MTAGLIVFGVVVGVYGVAALIVLATDRSLRARDDVAVKHGTAETDPLRAETVPLDRKLAGRESDTVRHLMSGSLDRAAYRSGMAVIAAQEDLEHPLSVPKLRQ